MVRVTSGRFPGAFGTLMVAEWRAGLVRFAIAAALFAGQSSADIVIFGPRVRAGEDVGYMITVPLLYQLIQGLPLVAILFAVLALRRELRGEALHLLLSLPVRGWTVLAAKFLPIAIQLAVLTALVLGTLWHVQLSYPVDTFVFSRRMGAGAALRFAFYSSFPPLLLLLAATLFLYVGGRAVFRRDWVAPGIIVASTVYVVLGGGFGALAKGTGLGAHVDALMHVLIAALTLWIAGAVWDRKLEV